MRRKQRQDWPAGEQPEQHYLIEPRALAGGGDIRHVFAYLKASGWQDKTNKNAPLALRSPDRIVQVSYDPYSQPGGWTIHSAATDQQAEWRARLGQRTPVEIVAGLTDALTQPRSAHAPHVWAPLSEQHWQTGHEGPHYTATSPDGAAWLHFRRGSGDRAVWWAGAQDEQGNGWTAKFTGATPLHLVAAFAAALASPEPVMRPRGRVPHSTRIRTTSVSVLPSQLGAWQQARITAARAAAWARNWPAVPPRATIRRTRFPFSGARR
ncbi:DUF317 domain-containing protein [Streptomyces sp. enrichment culture]|uniref:DUF317 domain-containing protein n=1 Tax=Streptomyces sp. enrichment culture TaxID=1795815 RepID=UPI003F56AB90